MQPSSNTSPRSISSHIFNPTLLREYDIRGIVGDTLFEDDAFALGLAFGTFIAAQGGNKICVGYDGRESSPAMAEALTQGLIATGMHVENVGIGPTPMLYFTVKDQNADGGIMVTGSHNPPDYNGFKMMQKSGSVFGETIQEIGRIAAKGDYARGEGSTKTIDICDAYVERLLKDYTATKHMKVAWDNGNGAAGEILQRLVAKLPGEHILLYEDIDGNFPNHHADPTVDENLVDLQKCVLENECDLGIAFDGDGDRIGVVNERGEILRADLLMTIYAREILANAPGASIIGDVKCSQVMFDEIDRLGGNGVMWKTGHSLIKDKMAELNAPLAGELSGHIFFADKYYGFDDALYCAIRLLNQVSEEDGPFSNLTKDLPVLHSTAEVRFEVAEEGKFDLVPKTAARLRELAGDDMQVNEIDGVRVTTKDGWWILRPSNTQNVLVARAEGNSAEGLKRLKDMLINEVAALGYTMTF